jgi:hypothetical protein
MNALLHIMGMLTSLAGSGVECPDEVLSVLKRSSALATLSWERTLPQVLETCGIERSTGKIR